MSLKITLIVIAVVVVCLLLFAACNYSNTFKSNKKPKEETLDISSSLDEYRKMLESYKNLKNNDIENIPDNELEDAVMSWMWNKFNDDWSNQYQIISSLPKPCQDVYSCRTVTDEINNGGLNQLFFNSTGQFAEMSIEGFKALGAGELSDIMKKAVEFYKENKSVLDAYNDGTMESFISSYDEKIFEELDSAFYEECDSVNMVEYIRLNAAHFGD